MGIADVDLVKINIIKIKSDARIFIKVAVRDDDITIAVTIAEDVNDDCLLETQVIDKGVGIDYQMLANLNRELQVEEDH